MRVFTLLFVLALLSFSVEAQSPVIAKQDFDNPVNLASTTSSPAFNSFSSSADGFGIYQRGVTSPIPFALLDDSDCGFATDEVGIVQCGKTDAFFGLTDTDNTDNPGGNVTASWTFDINNATNLSVEIEMGAMGDFESTDVFGFTYSIDGGTPQTLFSGATDNAGSQNYTLEDGDVFSLNDPFIMSGITLNNILTTLTQSVAGTGSQLTITFNGDTNGGDEAFVFDNICIRGIEAIAGCDELFFSQYMEGSGNNKCLEIYNPTDAAVSLDGVYSILLYSNTNTSANGTINLTGTIAPDDVLVVCNGGQAILPPGEVDITSGTVSHTGNDAYTLTKNGAVVDAIGQIGSGINYGPDVTLVRRSSITTGDTNGNDPFNVFDEWNSVGFNSGTGFGEHEADGCESCSITNVVISNLDCGNAPNEDDSFFNISFDVNNGTGEYVVYNPANGDLYTFLGTGVFTGNISGIGQANAAATPGTTAQVVVFDDNNTACISSNPMSILVPICPDPCPSMAEAFINEFHYDDAGADDDEFVEVAIANSWEGDLSTLTVSLYNGSASQLNVYGDASLDQFAVGQDDGTFTYYTMMIGGFSVSGIQNGSPDGFSLDCNGSAFQFLSYEGTFTAGSGPAMGMMSTDVGVQEGSGTPEGSSIELLNGTWINVCQNTKGAMNEGITECCDIEILSVNTTTACPELGGTITINASCSSCDGIQYSINGGASFQPSNTFMNQPAGSYQIVVQDQGDDTCEDMTTVQVSGPDGLIPAPWMATDVGNSGATGNAYSFDECSGEFMVDGGGNNAFPGTNADAVAFVNQSLCGDVTITAKLESVSPNGYGGVMIRETNASNAKQVSLFSNLQSIVRHEARYTTGGNKIVQAHSRPFPFWIRLQRQGDWIFGYYSTNGMNFQYVHAVFVPMNSCVQVGLASFSFIPGQQANAVFSNVSVTGGFGVPTAEAPVQGLEYDREVEKATTLFPNPATDQLNIDFGTTRENETTIRLRNELGQVVEQIRVEIPTIRTSLDVSNLVNGMYFIEVLSEGAETEVLRFIKTR